MSETLYMVFRQNHEGGETLIRGFLDKDTAECYMEVCQDLAALQPGIGEHPYDPAWSDRNLARKDWSYGIKIVAFGWPSDEIEAEVAQIFDDLAKIRAEDLAEDL